MEKKSAYPSPAGGPPPGAQPQQPQQPPQAGPPYEVPVPKGPGVWESLKGGMDTATRYNGNVSAQEWADMKLTPEQWMSKYQSPYMAYREWTKSVEKRQKSKSNTSIPMNWLQKSMWPVKIPGM